MKSFKSLFSLLAITGILLTACQKDFVIEEEPDPVDPPASTGTFLHKIYIVDSIAGLTDTAEIFTYFYDAQKRVTLITDSVIEGSSWVLFKSRKYQYNGTDSLPSRSVSFDYEAAIADNNPLLVDSVVSFHQYDGAGRNSYDSSVSLYVTNDIPPYEYLSITNVRTYQYSGNNIYSAATSSGTGVPTTTYVRDTALTDGNGNVIQSKRYEVEGGVSTLFLTAAFTYDNKVNPFSKISSFRTLNVLPFGETFIDEIQAKNNRLKATEDFGSNHFDEDLTGKYTYNSNNLPVKIADEYLNAPGEFYKELFVYRSL